MTSDDCSDALAECNKEKNFSINAIPCKICSCILHVTILHVHIIFLVDNKRVFLTPSKIVGSDYINASFIDVSELPIDSLVM